MEMTTINPIAKISDIEEATTTASTIESNPDSRQPLDIGSSSKKTKREKGYWRRSSFYQRREAHGNDFQITVPWSPQMYFSVRGAENFHIYLWILKDLAWTQKWDVVAWFFGISAISWSLVLVYHAFKDRNYNEIYMLCALILWLSANFVWMAGEVFADDDGYVLDKAATMMETAMSWIMFYYLVLKPFKLLPSDEKITEKYDDADLHPRFSFFSNWREYEHAHTFFWCGKDLAWNLDLMPMWIIFFIPTLLIGFDFMYVTYKSKTMMIDCAHYAAQFIWVIGNAVWAIGEIFRIPGGVDDDKGPYSVWHPSKVASGRCRWWSSVVLVIALAPIIALYLIWLPLTCMGKVKAADVPENEAFGRPSEQNPPVTEGDMERDSERQSEDTKVNISEVCGVSSGGLTSINSTIRSSLHHTHDGHGHSGSSGSVTDSCSDAGSPRTITGNVVTYTAEGVHSEGAAEVQGGANNGASDAQGGVLHTIPV